MRILSLIIILASVAPLQALTADQARIRLGAAGQLAKLQNNAESLKKIEQLGKQARRALDQKDEATAEAALIEAEKLVGLDPGGRSMRGIPVFQPTPEIARRIKEVEPEYRQALKEQDETRILAALEKYKAAMDTELGKPENALPGRRAEAAHAVDEKQNAGLFVRSMREGGKYLQAVSQGKPLPAVMARFYAEIARAMCAGRPMIQKHQPQSLAELDHAVEGACRIMLSIQQPAGHFPFPDLRGRNIRWEPIQQKLVDADQAAAKDGWIVSVDPSGGSQFDTGECGEALLRAGKLYNRPEWIAAGLKAADWAISQPLSTNFNYNCFSLSLLSRAYQISGEQMYLDAAISKWRLGVAPGQTESGRWIDPHNAKTVYHLIILRGLHDLLEVMPADRTVERERLIDSTASAVRTLCDEWEKLGITNGSYVISELSRHLTLNPKADPRTRSILQMAASVAYERTGGEGSFRMSANAVSPWELAHLHLAWK